MNGQHAGGIKVGPDGNLVMGDNVTPEMQAMIEEMMNKKAAPSTPKGDETKKTPRSTRSSSTMLPRVLRSSTRASSAAP